MIHNTCLEFKEELRYRDHTSYIILHHTEVDTPHTVEEVHQWHLNRKKENMVGIAYHYYIRKNGKIYTGRPYGTIGAHAGEEYNPISVGIGYEGDFNKEKMSEEQENAGVMLIALLSLAYEDAEVVMYCNLNDERTDPGKNFPFESLMKKVDTCKSYLQALFGDQRTEDFVVDYEWRHMHDHLGDEEEEMRRHNAPSIIHYGHFNYFDILDLLVNVEEDYWNWEI